MTGQIPERRVHSAEGHDTDGASFVAGAPIGIRIIKKTGPQSIGYVWKAPCATGPPVIAARRKVNVLCLTVLCLAFQSMLRATEGQGPRSSPACLPPLIQILSVAPLQTHAGSLCMTGALLFMVSRPQDTGPTRETVHTSQQAPTTPNSINMRTKGNLQAMKHNGRECPNARISQFGHKPRHSTMKCCCRTAIH